MTKQNKYTRVLSLVLALVMLMATVVCVAPAASAQMEGYLTYVVEENKVTITDCETHAKTITIPEKIGGNTVVAIGKNAFADCTQLTSVVIPESVLEIGAGAFSNCISLTTVNIPKTITGLAENIFNGCSSLAKIEIPEVVTTIGYGAFSGCSNLSAINLDKAKAIVTIDDWAFYNCSSLTAVTIADGVTKIGYNAFAGCSKITEIKLPEKTAELDYGAFADCTSLAKVEFVDGLDSIGSYAFKNCTALKKADLPKTVTKIGNGAFEGSGLAEVTLKKGLKQIGKEAFKNCKSLKAVEFPRALEAVGERVFEGCSALTSFVYALDATSVSKGMFKDCTALETIELPKRITSIGEKAFYGCSSLKSVIFNKNVKTIGDYAFYGSNDLIIYFKEDILYFDQIDIGENNFSKAVIWASVDVLLWDTSKIFSDIIYKEEEDENYDIVVTKDWYKEYVDYAYSHGMFAGKGNGKFEPNTNITRAEFVQVLANLSLINTTNKAVESKFKDVKSGEWYAPAVMWAYENEVVFGMGDETFAPNQNITREQMCVMLVNYVENYLMLALEEKGKAVQFVDESTISDWASEAVTKCNKSFLIDGDENKKFSPQDPATRAHASKIFAMFHYYYNEILPY